MSPEDEELGVTSVSPTPCVSPPAASPHWDRCPQTLPAPGSCPCSQTRVLAGKRKAGISLGRSGKKFVTRCEGMGWECPKDPPLPSL